MSAGWAVTTSGESPFQGRGDAAMQLLAPGAQQRAVGGVLYQSMFEGVFRIGWRPAPEDQFSAHELVEGLVQLLLRHSRDRTDEFIREHCPAPRWGMGVDPDGPDYGSATIHRGFTQVIVLDRSCPNV